MRSWIRFGLGVVALVVVTTAYVFSATTNYIPKYNSSGNLVDSYLRDVDGVLYVGPSSEAGRITYNSEWFYVDARNGRGLNLSNGRMVVLDSGNVGIGTTTPSAKLHVNGDVTVSGNISAKYQDVAEWVPSTEHLVPGTVVAADPAHRNHVLASSNAYDTAVAGVVSHQPGILLGEKSEGMLAVAQSGRVKVKVDASFGAIAPGDLLVTSPVSGYAMRSQPVQFGDVAMHRPGTIIGKALERLESGRAEILVLLTLQ